MGASGTRRPAALRHGLSSQYARPHWSGDVARVAEAVAGVAERDADVLEAARDEAEAILYLRRVRACRLHVIEEATLARCTPTEDTRAVATRLREAVKRGDLGACDALRDELRRCHDGAWLLDVETTSSLALGMGLAHHDAELRRLHDYERIEAARRARRAS